MDIIDIIINSLIIAIIVVIIIRYLYLGFDLLKNDYIIFYKFNNNRIGSESGLRYHSLSQACKALRLMAKNRGITSLQIQDIYMVTKSGRVQIPIDRWHK